jgi:hypothetical protein
VLWEKAYTRERQDKKSLRQRSVIPRSEKVEPKPLYVYPGCSIHTYSNNMIQMQCLIKHSKYLLHNDLWVIKIFTQMQWD